MTPRHALLATAGLVLLALICRALWLAGRGSYCATCEHDLECHDDRRGAGPKDEGS